PKRHFDAVARWLLGLAHQRPFVVVLEDLHWIDETSLGMLTALLRNMATVEHQQARLLLVMSARSEAEKLESLRELAAGQDWYQRIEISELSIAECTELVASMLDVRGSASDLGELLHRATAGNPFYIEEL